MDMLASFFASNYALYAPDPRHFGVWIPGSSHQPTQLSTLINPYPSIVGSQIVKSLPENTDNQKQQEIKSDAVKFSIENILKDTSRPKEKERLNSFEERSEKEAVASRQFSWLQCTRYKPPRLPREFISFYSYGWNIEEYYFFAYLLCKINQISSFEINKIHLKSRIDRV